MQVVDEDGGRDDVNDGVHGPDLVKADLLRWEAVRGALRGSENLEGPVGD